MSVGPGAALVPRLPPAAVCAALSGGRVPGGGRAPCRVGSAGSCPGARDPRTGLPRLAPAPLTLTLPPVSFYRCRYQVVQYM